MYINYAWKLLSIYKINYTALIDVAFWCHLCLVFDSLISKNRDKYFEFL